jgi:hypothetical protein
MVVLSLARCRMRTVSARVQMSVLFAAWLVAGVEEARALDDVHAGRTVDKQHAPLFVHDHGGELPPLASSPVPPLNVGMDLRRRGPPGSGGPADLMFRPRY